MRRKWMRALQRRSINWLPESRRAKAWDSHRKQNAFALRYGLKIITVMMNILLASILVTLTFQLALRLYETGILSPPQTRESGRG